GGGGGGGGPRGGGGDVWQVLVDLPAARARHCGARRPPARGLFPLASTLGDDRGGGAGARPARGVADRERFCAVLLRDRLAWGRLARIHHRRRVRLPRGQRRLCRGPAFDRSRRAAAEPRGRQRHGVAVVARAPAGGGRILGGAAAARLGRAVRRPALGLALVHVGLCLVAG